MSYLSDLFSLSLSLDRTACLDTGLFIREDDLF